MALRSTSRPAVLAVWLGVSVLAATGGSPRAEEESRPLLNPPAPPPADSAPRPKLRLRAASQGMNLELRRSLPERDRDRDDGVVDPPSKLPASRGERMKRAFETELREETIRSRRASLYATIPSELPELLEDDYIRKQQERVAESVIGDAFEAALSEGFFRGRSHESKLSIRPLFAEREHGMRIDASPSWTYRVRSERTGFRVDVPMTPTAIRLHGYRELKGTDRTDMRFGAGLLLDPWDEEVRIGFSLQF